MEKHQRFDNASISRLEHMQLSYVSFKPPSHFKGFPNLRKLHIQLLHVSRKDLEHMLSHCSNLAWLHIDRCNLSVSLIVDSPLSNPLYLHIEQCELTGMKFNGVNLATFEYEGRFIPIDLSASLKLHNVNIQFGVVVFQHAVRNTDTWGYHCIPYPIHIEYATDTPGIHIQTVSAYWAVLGLET